MNILKQIISFLINHINVIRIFVDKRKLNRQIKGLRNRRFCQWQRNGLEFDREAAGQAVTTEILQKVKSHLTKGRPSMDDIFEAFCTIAKISESDRAEHGAEIKRFIQDICYMVEAFYNERESVHEQILTEKIRQLTNSESNASTGEEQSKEIGGHGDLETKAPLRYIHIKSLNQAVGILSNSEACDLTMLFDNMRLKPGYSWADTILPKVQEFSSKVFLPEGRYQIQLDTGYTIAFLLGAMIPECYPMEITINQTINGKTYKWECATPPAKSEDISVICEDIDPISNDIVLVLSLTHMIQDCVKAYLKEVKIEPKHILCCTISEQYGSQTVEDCAHALAIKDKICSEVEKRVDTKSTLHIFVSGPKAIMFFLGRASRYFGQVQIYEYDRVCRTYYPTIRYNFTN